MKVLAYQSPAEFGDKESNLGTIEAICKGGAALGVSLAVFPELFLTGYNLGSRARDFAEPMDGPSVRRLSSIAKDTGVAIVVGFPESSADSLYNTAVAIDAKGRVVGSHRKVFLFGSKEQSIFDAGTGFNTFELCGYRCALSICYDIEFPEVARSAASQGAEVLINPTANMSPYYDVPTTLARARALENGIAVVYANLCGEEPGQKYTGLSAIIGPDGLDISRAGVDSTVLISDLGPSLARHRANPQSHQLRDLASWKSQ